VLKKLHRAAHHEQPQSESIRLRNLKPMKRLEYIPQLSSWNANAGVVHLDANNRPKTTASRRTRPPEAVNFTAFRVRLPMTLPNRTGSLMTTPRVGTTRSCTRRSAANLAASWSTVENRGQAVQE